MFCKVLLVILTGSLLVVLAACAAPASPLGSSSDVPVPTLKPVPPTPTPPAGNKNCVQTYQWGDRYDVNCTVWMVIRTKFQNEVVMEEKRQTEVSFSRMPITKNFTVDMFGKKVSWTLIEELEQHVIDVADLRVMSSLGLRGNMFSARYEGLPNSKKPYMEDWQALDFNKWSGQDPFDEWVFNFSLGVKNDPIHDPKDWTVISRRNNTTTYVNYQSPKGRVEIPIRDTELTYLLQGKFTPLVAEGVKFQDPAATAGADKYEEIALQYATKIKNDGSLVGRFEWTDFESQEVVLNALANAMLVKAVAQPAKTYQAAWYGFLREKQIVSTDIVVSSRGSRGSFFLGIGRLTGGSSLISIRQQQSSSPAIFGDLYLLSK